jgi:hypothetical protein
MVIMGFFKRKAVESDRSACPAEKLHRRPRRLRRILGGVLITATLATTCALLCDKESGKLSLYKQGKIGIEELSLEDKIEAWRFTMAQGGRCSRNFDKVLGELQEEQFRLMRLKNEAGVKMLSEIRETLISSQRAIREKFPECIKDAGE